MRAEACGAFHPLPLMRVGTVTLLNLADLLFTGSAEIMAMLFQST